jgi:hypothetical protein
MAQTHPQMEPQTDVQADIQTDSQVETHARAQTNSHAGPEQLRWYNRVWEFVALLISSLFEAVRALLLLIFKTPFLLLPSAANTSPDDEKYNANLVSQLNEIVAKLGLEEGYQQYVMRNWIDQVKWTNERALRERDANELIRWWQVILSVMIPILSTSGASSELISITGIFLAILTGIYQFRRPEDRWRHYRTINEQYLGEIWDFIALSGEAYVKDRAEIGKTLPTYTHKDAFPVFNLRMRSIAREDVIKFFSTVVPSSQEKETEEKGKEKEADQQNQGSQAG